jgi:hypothetical protein
MTMTAEQASPVSEALSAVRSLLGETMDHPLWTVDADGLGRLLVDAGTVVAQAQAVLLRLVGEADARGVLLEDGAPSAQAWLRHRLRLSPAEAAAHVRTARALRDGLPETARACSGGEISAAHAAVVTRTMAELPPDPQLRRDAERDLVEHATRFEPTVLARISRRLLAVVDPEAADARDGDALARAEERAARRMELTLTPDGEGGSWLRGRLDPTGASVVRSALDPLSGPRPSAADGPDRRVPARRRAEALVEVCRRVLASGELPATGGDRPQVVVTVPLATLRSGKGTATLDGGTVVSAVEARRLACDARIIPAVLGGAGEILDLGRARRLFTGALRRALVLRDGGCAFPGCDRPHSWCEAHHIDGWAAGGDTALDNGVLLCGHHHRLVERGDWEVDLDPGGLPQFHPPLWVDPDRRPRHNTVHRTRASPSSGPRGDHVRRQWSAPRRPHDEAPAPPRRVTAV